MKGYETLSLAGLLEENSYPGRGIVLGMTPDGVTEEDVPIKIDVTYNLIK